MSKNKSIIVNYCCLIDNYSIYVLFSNFLVDTSVLSLQKERQKSMKSQHKHNKRHQLTRTEIENQVKARCTYLTSRKHVIPESSGKKIRFGVTEKDLEHLVSDALYRSKEILRLDDISILHQYFQQAQYIKTEKESKKGKTRVFFHYYEITIDGRVLYLNIKEDVVWKTTRLHSITTKIQTAASQERLS